MTTTTPFWSRVFVVFAIMMTTSAFYFLFAAPQETQDAVQQTARQSPIYTVLWLALYAAAAFIVARDTLKSGFTCGTLIVLTFSAFIFVSVFWSISAPRTFFYGGMLVANLIVGVALAVLLPPRQMLRTVTMALCALMLVSFALLAIAPQYVTSDRYGGAWMASWQYAGVFSHKSDAGYYFAMLSLLVAHGPFFHGRPLIRAIIFLLTLASIALANSATALAAALVLNTLLVVTNRAGSLSRFVLPVAGMFAVIFSIAIPFIDIGGFATLLDRDVSLTGRLPIWAAAKQFITEKPFLGYGYYGFFDLGPYSPVWELWKIDPYFRTPHFHNTALDILVSLGLAGLAGYLVLLAAGFMILANHSLCQVTRNLMGAILILFLISAAFDFTFLKHNAFATAYLAYLVVAGQRIHTSQHT